VTYDDPETYAVKYRWALDNGFRGVGFWMADTTDGNQEAIREMWAAVP
jgi:GH18 family chitinase